MRIFSQDILVYSSFFTKSDEGLGFLGKSFKGLNAARKDNGWRGNGGVWQTLFSHQPKEYLSRKQINTINEYNAAIDNELLTEGKLEEITKDLTVAQKKYFVDLNGGKATQEGYAEACGVATKSTIGLTAASTAANAAITLGLSLGIQALVTGIGHLAHASEEAQQRLDEFNQTVTEGRDALKAQSDFINSDDAKKLEKLAKGVDAYGNNVSLTAKQFEEYHSITNQVAEMFPQMLQGWDDQGNAILANKLNVEELTKAYEENRKAYYDSVYVQSAERFKDFKKDIGGVFKNGKDVYDARAYKRFIDNNFNISNTGQDRLVSLLNKAGVEYDRFNLETGHADNGFISITDPEMQRKVLSAYRTLIAEMNAESAKIKSAIEAYLNIGNSDYSNLSKDLQQQISKIVQSFDWEFLFGFNSDTELFAWVDSNLIQPLKDNPDLSLSIDDFVKLDSSATEGEYEKAVQNIVDAAKKAGLDDNAIVQIKLAFGIDESASDERDNRIDELASKMANTAANDLKDAFRKEQIDLMLNGDIDVSSKTIDQLRDEINAKLAEKPVAITLSDTFDSLENSGMPEALAKLKSAMDEVAEDSSVNWSTVKELNSMFKNSVPNIEDYTKTLLDAGSTTKDLSKAIIGLTKDYITHKVAAGEFKDADEAMIASMLKEAGIANSTALAQDIVAGSRAEAAREAYRNGEITEEEARQLIEESSSADIAAQELARLEFAKYSCGAATINTASDIDNLIAMANVANLTAESIRDITRAKYELAEGFVGPVSPSTADLKAGKYQFKYNSDDFKAKITAPKFRPSGASSKEADGAKKAADSEKALADKRKEIAKAQYNADFEYRMNQITQSLDNQAEALERLKTVYDGFAENDYAGKLDNLNTAYESQTQYSASLKSNMDELLAITPTTSEAWDKLASQLETISDKYFESQRAVIEYRNSIQEAYIESQGYLADMVSNSVEKADMSGQIKNIMENGSFTRSMFDFDGISYIPQSLVDKQKAENKKLEAEQKRYQDAINEIRKKATDETKAYDDEQRRQELEEAIQSYNETMSDIKSSASEVISDVSDNIAQTVTQTNDIIAEDTKSTIDEISEYAKNNPVTINVETSQSNSKPSWAQTADNLARYGIANNPNHPWGINQKASGGDTSGLTLVNDGTGKYAGTEGYVGADGKLHWLKDGGQLFDTNSNVHIINAEDMREIIKHTGDRYFNEPIGDLASVTKYAHGNTSVSFNSTGNESLDSVAASINSQFDRLKSSINVEPVKTAIYNALTDRSYYDKLASAIGTETGKAVSNKDIAASVYSKIIENSSWDDLTDEIQEKFSELGASKDNWDDFVSKNKLQAVELMQDGSVNSWDLLSPAMQDIITDSGLASSETWSSYVNGNPLEALILLTSSWDNMKAQILQYMSDSTEIAQSGADAIHAIQIEAPGISQASWDALQTLIANKIQEILTVINDTFGKNTVDLNFNVGLNGTPQTNPQGVGSGSGSSIVSTARSGVGKPYVWGGTTPSGWDCSGFVINVMAQNGIAIPERTTQEQWASNRGTRITDKSQLQPGDAMYFADSSGSVHHTAIYAGNGQMIHAANERLGTIVQDFNNSSYYQSSFVGAKRYYAVGTKDYGIAGENYKLEWAINKQNGKWTPITEPTLFDKSKYDIVGEKVSERLESEIPVFAKGTKSFEEAIASLFGAKTGTGESTQEKETEGRFPKYNLTSAEAEEIARVITGETGGVNKQSVYAEASQMANLHEVAYGRDNSVSLLTSVKRASRGGWYADASWGRGVTDLARQAVSDVLIHGFRTLPRHVYEHDTFPMDIIGALPRSSYVQGVTPVLNRYGASGVFWAFPDPNGDIFFYTSEANRRKYGDFCYDINQVPGTGAFGGIDTFSQKLNEIFDKLKAKGMFGSFKTNTHTSNSSVAPYNSLGNSRQATYDFNTNFTAHSDGTKDYHIAGENYNPEIAIDKRTGQMSIIDSPTLFDPERMEIVGEDTTAKLFTHAEGTLTDEQKKHLETINAKLADDQKYSENDIPWDLSELEDVVKSINNIDKELLDENGLATRKIIEGYAELNKIKKAVEDDTIKKQSTEFTKQYNKDMEELTKQYQDIGTHIGNEYQYVIMGLDSGATALSRLFGVTQEAYEKASEYQGQAAQLEIKYYKDQLTPFKAIADNLKKFRDEQADTPDLWNQANDELEVIESKMSDIEDKIAGKYEAEAERMKSDLNQIRLEIGGAFKEGISYLAKDGDAIQKQINRAADIQDDAERAQVTNQGYEALLNNYTQQRDRYNIQRQQAHDYAERLRNNPIYADLLGNYPIDELFDAAGEFNDKYYEILAELNISGNEDKIQEFKAVTQGFQESKKLWLEADDAIAQLDDSIYDTAKSQKDYNEQLKLDKIDKYVKLQNRIAEILEYQKILNDRIVAATQSRNALAQELRDTVAEAEKELRTSQHLEEWLDPDTRAQLFNENDYRQEIAEVRAIQKESNKLYENYRRQISGLHEEDAWQAEAITAEYEKQREALEEQLGIAKQQLDIAKKKSAYENAQKERDTQIVMGGILRNVHDPEDLYNKAQELADAEINLANTQTTNSENASVRDMERFSDKLADKIAEIANRTDMIAIMEDEDKKIFADFIGSLDDINIMLETLTKSNPWYLTSTDDTHELYGDIDTEMTSHGYRLTWDYEAHMENLDALLEQGVIAFSHYNDALDMLMQDHDYKGSTDTYQSIMRNNYPLHRPGASQLKGLHEMKVYADDPLAEYRAEKPYVEKSVDTDRSPTVSGDGAIIINGIEYIPTDITPLSTMLQTTYNFPPYAGAFASAMDNIPDSVFTNIGSQDNSTNYHLNGDIVIENATSADDIISELTQSFKRIHSVTNNMR